MRPHNDLLLAASFVGLLIGAVCCEGGPGDSSDASPESTEDADGGLRDSGSDSAAYGTSVPEADAPEAEADIEADDGGADAEGDAAPLSDFTAGHVLIAGSRNAEVFEYDEELELVSRWTHPMFGVVLPPPGQSLELGPQGMAFDADGRLVVATLTHFCVFSAPGEEVACYPKVREQATENIIFDSIGHLYTTTSTGGTNEVHKYTADYEYLTTFSAPTGSLTGITCDGESNLYVASQTGGCLYEFDRADLTLLDTIPVAGSLEGLQFSGTDAIYVAAHGGVPTVQRVRASSPAVLVSSVSIPGFALPVAITTDGFGRIYVADYENGSGTAPADLFIVDPDGDVVASREASEVYGPFGIVVAGVELPCGAFHPNE